eukprot:TRINITY_DN4517_c0_g1_i2.p1 TRINITY_DN4517_c0_g1~~TRINITY_DN4517_c0_g1_i2.p1  ORF type:complete len:629 (+),score=80.25 TRINITY_DN4517_c0_g1_i2:186-2072(+)
MESTKGLKESSALREETRNWEYAGKGVILQEDDTVLDSGFTQNLGLGHIRLGQMAATAISGNDITSSCLYVAGLSAASSGKYAPISLFLVVVVLWLFRGVYSEVGSALPLNGGAYNILLNTTTKFLAALAACLTLLSYVATAVVSGTEACEYLYILAPQVNPLWSTVALLGVFCLLNLVGISESSIVALVIFFIHCTTLLVLIVLSLIFAIRTNFSVLVANWDTPPIRSPGTDVFFGFCSGLLGVSGFESSSNFIEEQKPGVFTKTLRNMWVAVAFFNPLISLLSLSIIPLPDMTDPAVQSVVLAEMGRRVAGEWLAALVSANAFLVLSGAVLTAYVGVTGLVRRMALDRLLPRFLLTQNTWRNTNHWIILVFFLVTSSLFLVVSAGSTPSNAITTLAGVYTISFLSVMGLFAIGNLLLKYKRSALPRTHKTFWGFVVLASGSVTSALVGNIIYNVSTLKYFAIYFLVTMFIIGTMIFRIRILRIIYLSASKISFLKSCMGDRMKTHIKQIQDTEMIFYTRRGKLSVLNKAILYIRDNEITDKIKIIHCYETKEDIPPKLVENVKILDRCYPKTRIDLLLVRGKFSPGMVDHLSRTYNVPKNFMFITCPGDKFPNNIAEFGGVRLITH